jgi:hypothetical protein
MSIHRALPLLLLCSCAWIPEADHQARRSTLTDDTCAPAPVYADADGDGYGDPETQDASCGVPEGWVEDASDCDDSDADVNPDADELCDSQDNDCDGEVDEDDADDAPTWYYDADEDGYAGSPRQGCTQQHGEEAEPSDCDDRDGDIHPEADELCDGEDNDCDGTVDEDDAIDAPTWYADDDGDGYGDEGDPTAACDQPTGYVGGGEDCDDTDPDSFPDALDTCGDGIDQDCSGADATCTLWGELDIDADAIAWQDADASLGGTGQTVVVGDDVDGDGHAEVMFTAPYYEFGEQLSRLWIVPGHASLTGGTVSLLGSDDGAFAITGAQPRDALGMYGFSGGADLDGDTQPDLALASPAWELSEAGTYTADDDEGRVYLIPGPVSAGNVEALATVVIQGAEPQDRLGFSVSAVGDIDGSGAGDLVVNSDRDLGTLLYSDPLTGSATLSPADASLSFSGYQHAADACDLDGDGLDDLVLGLDGVMVFWGSVALTGAVGEDDADLFIDGGGAPDAGGDVDGDGLPDLLLRASAAEDSAGVRTGRADLVTSGTLQELITSKEPGGSVLDLRSATVEGDTEDQYFAATGLILGDTNRDDRAEVVLGANYDDTMGANAGVVYLYYGPLEGTLGASADAQAWVYGTTANDHLGHGLAGGDVDGDGASDLLVGSPGRDASCGQALLFFGGGLP